MADLAYVQTAQLDCFIANYCTCNVCMRMRSYEQIFDRLKQLLVVQVNSTQHDRVPLQATDAQHWLSKVHML